MLDKPEDKSIFVRMPQDLFKAIALEALERGISRTKLMREILSDYFWQGRESFDDGLIIPETEIGNDPHEKKGKNRHAKNK